MALVFAGRFFPPSLAAMRDVLGPSALTKQRDGVHVAYQDNAALVMGKIELFVVGGSAGALEALQKIAPQLPPGFPAPICLVLHLSPDSPGLIPEILTRAGPLQVKHAEDGEEASPGKIYVAPPDHHLLIDARRCRARRIGLEHKRCRFWGFDTG